MTNPHLALVAPTTVIGTVSDRRSPPRRKRNAEVRVREYLTDAEVARLIDAGGKNRYGHRDATMVLVAYRHGLRAALTPVVTMFGLDLATLLGGAVITETVFNLPGIGQYAVQAIYNTDFPSVMGVTIFGAFFFAIANLLVDVAYAFLDPRVRYT